VKYLVGLLFVLLVPLTAAAEEIDAKAVDALVVEALKAFQVPGAAVAIVQDDRVVYLKGHGVRELVGTGPLIRRFAISATPVRLERGREPAVLRRA
jgi:CubicO group peptidase (beta-lactamase class C family)